MKKYPNIDYSLELQSRAIESIKAGHYLEASIIIFQLVEIFLRIGIRGFGAKVGVKDSTLTKCAEEEISFSRLTRYLDLILPNNDISEELRELNAERNRIMHKLFFEFTDVNTLNERLKAFCLQGVELQNKLKLLLLGEN
ncbi:MAG: hypothetical protein JXA41_03280 [Deltaproteobacteria bacterium]|nr:hypothetical protein [Deltaproteobacteria bacterium]